MDPRTVHTDQQYLQVLDVRDDHEWQAGHIQGAIHIPLGELRGRADELDAAHAVVTVCRAGGRASRAAEYLTSLGRNARVMHGGMQEWDAQALPHVSSDGTPSRIV